MSDDVFDILKAAVNLARTEQIRRVPALLARLSQIYPGKELQVKEAVNAWAAHAHGTK